MTNGRAFNFFGVELFFRILAAFPVTDDFCRNSERRDDNFTDTKNKVEQFVIFKNPPPPPSPFKGEEIHPGYYELFNTREKFSFQE